MNTKLLYVVVSSYNDFYLEQAYLSMFSAKKFNDDCHISLLVDSITYESFIDSRKKLTQLADEIIIADIERSLPSHYRSRLLKTGARKHISGDFLFIDSDTIIVKRLDDIDSLTGSIYACMDSHALLAQNPYKRRILHDVKMLGHNLSDEDLYFNSGVIYVKDNEESHQFYKLWESLYIKGKCDGVSMDQPSFCVANLQMGKLIKILPDEWNCELKHGVRFLNSAKIIHYLCTNISKDNEKQVFILNESKIFDSIKNNGEIPPSVENCIENPDSGLSYPTTIVAGCDNFILQSFCYALIKKLYAHPLLFNSIEKLISELSVFFTKLNKRGGGGKILNNNTSS